MKIDPGWLQSQFPTLHDISPLSEGGQKQVFRCYHQERGDCVLKVVLPGSEGRMDREIEAVVRVGCEFIPQIYQIGEINAPFGRFIVILEQRINGFTLRERLQSSKNGFSKTEILNLAYCLLSAATHAENAKVVHRDIKPENIIIETTGKAWLLDFGIARILDLDSMTRTDAVSGPHTPGYGAPEQFRYRKHDIDGRTDLFAIGVVLYEVATGINPFLFRARDRIDVLNRVEKMPLSRLKLDWDDGQFADLVATMTQKFPHQRPRACSEALGWLNEIIANCGGLK